MPMPLTPITAFNGLNQPQRDNPADFSDWGDTWVAAEAAGAQQHNVLAGQVNNMADAANTSATNAANSASAAATSASNSASSATAASNSASAAAAASGATAWVSGGTYALNTSAISQLNFQTYRKITASSVTTVDPRNDPTNWTPLTGVVPIPRVPRNSNTQLTQANTGAWLNATASFTQTFDTAGMAPGWHCWYSTDPSAEVTIPSSDGMTNWIMYGGETRLFQWDGATLRSFVVTPFFKAFTASGNFIKPPGYQYFEGLIWNGGNGGQKDSAGGSVRGGAGGGCFPFVLAASSLAASTAITVGAGGIGPSSTANGGLGGASSIGALIVMSQSANFAIGSGINAASNSSTDSTGFEGAGSNASAPRKIVWGGGAPSDVSIATASTCVYGGAAGGSIDNTATVRAPGTSAHGGNGGAASAASSGTNGTAPGGGGGATQTGAKAGDGARGEVRVWGKV